MRQKSLIFTALLLSSLSSAFASSGTEGAAFLDIPVGAGPASLGSAYSALASDAYAPIYNPAGLGFLSIPQLSAQHLSYLDSIHDEFGSFVMPLGHHEGSDYPTKAFGASIQYLGSGDIAGTDNFGVPTGNFSAHYAAYSFAYGQRLTNELSLGLTGKAIQAKIDDTSASAYAADFGAMYKPTDKLSLAATLNNVGTHLTFTSQGDSLPMAFHLGGAYQLVEHLKSTAELVYNKTGLLAGRFGAEWSPMEVVALRVGYKTDTVKELSPLAGMTMGLGLHLFGQEFAYAWLPYGDLGDTQYFSLLLKFGAKEEERKNLIQYQDIKRHRTVKNHGTSADPSAAPNTTLDLRDQVHGDDQDYQQLMQLMSTNDTHVAQDQSSPLEQPR